MKYSPLLAAAVMAGMSFTRARPIVEPEPEPQQKQEQEQEQEPEPQPLTRQQRRAQERALAKRRVR